MRIGRSADNDIVTADRNVSRLHAELLFRDEHWRLVSRGRNGVFVDGRQIQETIIASGDIFRLAVSGPMLRFTMQTDAAGTGGTETLLDPQEDFSYLEIDEFKKEEEVQQIVDDDAFRELKERSRALKKQRQDDIEGETETNG